MNATTSDQREIREFLLQFTDGRENNGNEKEQGRTNNDPTEAREQVSSILGVPPSNIQFGWELWVDDSSYSYSESVEYFCSLLERNIPELLKIKVVKENIELWILYEYEQQCNFEFHPTELARISNLGIVLCIGCWQKGSELII